MQESSWALLASRSTCSFDVTCSLRLGRLGSFPHTPFTPMTNPFSMDFLLSGHGLDKAGVIVAYLVLFLAVPHAAVLAVVLQSRRLGMVLAVAVLGLVLALAIDPHPVAVGAIVLAACIAYGVIVPRRPLPMRPPGACQACGYDMRGLVGGAGSGPRQGRPCPECGERFDPAALASA